MKVNDINSQNVGISILYCIFGILSLIVLKITIKYFSGHKQKNTKEIQQLSFKPNVTRRLNLIKIFAKSFFFKNTLIGSIFNEDKKYLLRELLVLSAIAVCCFNINKYIFWPFAVGTGIYLFTFILQISASFFNNKEGQNGKKLFDEKKSISKKNSEFDVNSIQIQHTQLQISLSVQRGFTQPQNQNGKQQYSEQLRLKSKIELISIVCLSIVTQILICQSILTLSQSVSNSGALNLVSLSICIFIDQLVIRTGFGLLNCAVLAVLYYIQQVQLTENRYYISICYHQLVGSIESEEIQRKIQETGQKIANINNPYFIDEENFKKDSHLPLVFQENSRQEYVYEEQNQFKKVQALKIEDKGSESQQQTNITDFFELFEYDLQMFTQKYFECAPKFEKVLNKKRKPKPQEKIKQDPLLYFPYEEHKQSNRTLSRVQNSQNEEDKQSEQRSTTVQHHFISKIQILDCIDDSDQSQEPQIGTVLHERNLNIKTLTINQKPQIPPTHRPKSSSKHKQQPSHSKSMKTIKKVSPYLVNLPSEAVKPQKFKKQKMSKMNNENKNLNNSLLGSQAVDLSRVTQKNVNLLTTNYRTLSEEVGNFAKK